MKLSISLPGEDVEFLDRYAHDQRVGSRSAVIREALALLRLREVGADYAQAWAEWDDSGDGAAWAPVVGDGVSSPS